MFDQFRGTLQAPEPQQLQLDVARSGPPTPLIPIVTPSKGDPMKEIRKRAAKEFLGDKSDDPAMAEQWLSRVCSVIKEMKCIPENC